MAPTGRGGRKNIHRRNQNKPTSPSNPTTTKTLPTNLIIKILIHTDPKSLARCKCVSKSWYALITHPLFIKKHLHFNTLHTNTHVICNAYNNTRNRSRDGSHSHNRDKVVSLLSVDRMPVRLFDIDIGSTCSVNFPSNVNFVDFSKKMILAGSINGVVLVSHMGELNGRVVGLWNPGINQWKVIRINREDGLSEGFTVVGLGYDKGSDDFKIVRIVTESFLRINCSSNYKWDRVEVYSVNRDCWEEVYRGGELEFWSRRYHCNFVVKGVPYFSGVDVMPDSTAAFRHGILARIDPCTGLFEKVNYPEYFRAEGTWTQAFEYQDSVAIMVQATPGFEEQMIDMYVLDDDTTTWRKMYSLGPFPILEFHEPLQSFKTGEIVLEEQLLKKRGLFLYNPKVDRVSFLHGIDSLELLWSESYSHSESLVSIEGMELIRKDKNKKTKPKKMSRTELLSKDFESALQF